MNTVSSKSFSRILCFFCLHFSFLQSAECFVKTGSKEMQLSSGFMHFYFEETADGQKKFDTEEGYLPFIEGSLSIPYDFLRSLIDLQLRFSYAAGDTKYIGAFQNEAYGSVVAKTRNEFFGGQALVGCNFLLGKKCCLRGYAGIAYRNWHRHLLGDGGFLETYSWVYLPVGASLQYLFYENWSVKLAAAYLPVVQCRLNIELYNGVKLNLGKRPGYQVEAELAYSLNDHWRLGCSPWFQQSEFGMSNKVLVNDGGVYSHIYEPQSKTRIWGSTINLHYFF